MRTLESVEGNTWRGLSPSAEGMGEFFGFTILFSIIIFLEKKIEPKLVDYLLVIICFAALVKTNNAAAIVSVVLFLLIYILIAKLKFNSKKIIGSGVIFLISLIIFLYFQILGTHSYQYLSNTMLFEGVNASIITEDVNKNQFGQTQSDLANYAYILNLPQEDAQLSSSLRLLLESYNSNINVKYLPKLVSILSAISFFTNRSEKWGIFFAKYDPSNIEFLFGYGPQQFTDFYLDHPTLYNFGLFLPHSSIFNLMIFYGIFGLLIIMSYIFIKFKDNLNSPLTNIFIFYFVLNFFKSDSLLYLPNFVFFVFICNFYKFELSPDNDGP